MNPLKFKAYCTERNEWVNIIDLGMFSTGEVKEVAYTYDSEPYERKNSRRDGRIKLVQYTGSKDTLGVEMYERDFVEHTYMVYQGYGDVREKTEIALIESMTNHPFDSSSIGAKVIGNEFQNPELLKKVGEATE